MDHDHTGGSIQDWKFSIRNWEASSITNDELVIQNWSFTLPTTVSTASGSAGMISVCDADTPVCKWYTKKSRKIFLKAKVRESRAAFQMEGNLFENKSSVKF